MFGVEELSQIYVLVYQILPQLDPRILFLELLEHHIVLYPYQKSVLYGDLVVDLLDERLWSR